jgi:hypothetical protein
MVVAVIADNVRGTSGSVAHQLVRWVMVLRVVGIVRLLAKFQQYQLVFRALASLEKQLPKLLLAFAVVLAFFGVVGVQIFGGKVQCLPSSSTDEVEMDAPLMYCTNETMHYLYAINCNDFVSAESTLITMMIAGDWTNSMSLSPA